MRKACPECGSRIVKDEELGESVCQSCGLVVEQLDHLVNQQVHGGTPSFNFLYDKALPTVFDSRDVKGERAREFKRLRFLDRSVRGVRNGEVTVLNVQRKIMPMVERVLSGKPELTKNVKARVTELVLNRGLPRVDMIYHAVVCQAILEYGVCKDESKLLERLTGSKISVYGKTELSCDAGAAKWTGVFHLDQKAPVDRYMVKVTALVPSEGRLMRGIAVHEFNVVSEKHDGSADDPVSRSRLIDDRLMVSVSLDREAYCAGEPVHVAAEVKFPDGRVVEGNVQGAKVKAALTSGGRFRAAEKALWALRKQLSIRSTPKTCRDFVSECAFLKGEKFEVISNAEETLSLFHDLKTPMTARMASALATWMRRPELRANVVAKEFGVSPTILQAKRDVYLSLRSQPVFLRG